MSTTSGPTEPDTDVVFVVVAADRERGLVRHLPILPRHRVGHPREAFLAPEQHQHIENPRRCRPPGERGPQRLRHLAKLDAFGLGNLPHRLLRRRLGPFRERGEGLVDAGEQVARARLLAGSAAFSSMSSGRRLNRKAAPSASSFRSLARGVSTGMARTSSVGVGARRSSARPARPAGAGSASRR